MTWKIEARELPVAGVGTHLYIEMWDDAGNRYKQMHGYWTDPVSGQPSTSGDDSGLIKGYNNLVLNSTLGSTPSNHPHAGTTLFDGSEVQVKEAFRYASSAVEYINAQNYSYTLLGAGSLSSNGTKFNSNNVFSTLVDAVQLAVPINQSIVGGVESPHSFIGAGTNMFRGNEWRPNVDMPSVDQNGNVVYGSWVRDTGETNTLIGTQYNDVLIGSDTTITGGNSLDTLIGNEGNDYLDGRTGKDSLIGGAGNDTIDGGLDNGDVAEGGAGNDTYIFNGAFGSNEYVKDSDGQGRIVIDGNTLSGVATLVVNTSSTTTWTLQGYTLRASGNIAIDSKGTAGNSVMVYDLKPGQSWLGITLDNTTNGTAGNDSLGGGKYADSMVGAAGNDTISAGAGNDTLVGGTGADLLRGDSGNDTYVYKAADGADTISDGYSSTDITDSVTITGYALSAASFSRVGTTNDLRIAFTGSSTDSILVQQGLDGNYSVESFVFASGGTKTIAAIRADVLAAQTTAGNDTIVGFAGAANTINGGAGNDSLTGSSLTDVLKGDAGNDTLKGSSGNDFLTGGLGLDSLEGGSGNDMFYFNKLDGTDIFYDRGSSSDIDTLTITGYASTEAVYNRVGNSDDFTITFTSGADSITIQQGLEVGGDTLENIAFTSGGSKTATQLRTELLAKQVTAGNDTITAFTGVASTISGGAGNDSLTGGTQADVVLGEAGNDTVIGGSGVDSLSGGLGIDLLTGGSSGDRFNFAKGDTGAGLNADSVSDFSRTQADKIALLGYGLSAAGFVGTGAFTAGGAVEFGYTKFVTGNYILIQIDSDNNGISDQEIRLNGIQLDMLASDFLYA